jgi:hypothetical protein
VKGRFEVARNHKSLEAVELTSQLPWWVRTKWQWAGKSGMLSDEAWLMNRKDETGDW